MEDRQDDDRLATVRALGEYRDYRFAEWLVFALGVAAESHPEEVRKALGNVFDLSSVEDTTKRMMLVCSEAQATVTRMRQEVGMMEQSIQADLDRIEQRIERMHVRINQAAQKFAKLPCGD